MSQIAAIIPVYNAKDTLARLLESLQSQTLRDFAAIFVDDGSTDGTREMLRAASADDARMILVEAKHDGPGAARNAGLDEADRIGAEFITFIDADDFLVPDAFATATSILIESGADIVHYPWAASREEAESAPALKSPSIYVWNKMYRRRAVEGVRFIRSTFSEDLAYYLETNLRNPTRIGSPRALYVHVKRPESLWESRTPETLARSMKAATWHLSQLFAANPTSPDLRDWRDIYLPKLLKIWRSALRRLPRVMRKKEQAIFRRQVAELRKARQFPLFNRHAFRFRVRTVLALAFAAVRDASSSSFANVVSLCRRCRAASQVRGLRTCRRRPIRVMFLVTEISKWKTRTLFGAMKDSPCYEPVLGIGLDHSESRRPPEDRRRILDERMLWFRAHDIPALAVFDADAGKAIDLRKARPDVVFYQQPWQVMPQHSPERVSRHALTFYVPYCMADFGNLDAECLMPFFQHIFGYFVQSVPWAMLYRAAAGRKGCRFIPAGHPILDNFDSKACCGAGDGLVIYAPHWTFHRDGFTDLYPYGTFEWSGREILQYAQRHADWKWVFKPHPLLRATLTDRGLMSKEEADAYYAAWERLGTVCYDADYPRLFMRSRAMITDSGSFLVEYGATGKPLIHLKPPDSPVETMPPNKRLFDSYYRATDRESMFRIFEKVLERNEDPAREERINAARASGLFNNHASDTIMQYLNMLFETRKDEPCKD